MTTTEIADRLVQLCRKGDFDTAQNELFSEDAVSIEPHAAGGFEKETKGLTAIKEKGEKWRTMGQESRGIEVSDPLVVHTAFACTIKMHVTMQDGSDMDMAELCVYKTRDGKIISEEFFM